MRFYFIFILCLACFISKAQDKIITKSPEQDLNSDKNLKIETIGRDTLYYRSNGSRLKIASSEVVAIRKSENKNFTYIKPSDERIYGIKNDKAFFKSDYKFQVKNSQFSMACFLERFRIYDSIVPKSKKGHVCLENKETGRKKRIHENVKLCFYLKDDILNRKYKGWVHHISKDSSLLIMKVHINGEKHIYAFRNEDLKIIGMEAPTVFLGRHTLALASISTGVFAWTAVFYYKGKWYRKYSFDQWHLSK